MSIKIGAQACAPYYTNGDDPIEVVRIGLCNLRNDLEVARVYGTLNEVDPDVQEEFLFSLKQRCDALVRFIEAEAPKSRVRWVEPVSESEAAE